MEKVQSALTWLVEEFDKIEKDWEKDSTEYSDMRSRALELAEYMFKEQSHEYAEFAIRCDRKDMKILNFEDWIKLKTFKSEQ